MSAGCPCALVEARKTNVAPDAAPSGQVSSCGSLKTVSGASPLTSTSTGSFNATNVPAHVGSANDGEQNAVTARRVHPASPLVKRTEQSKRTSRTVNVERLKLNDERTENLTKRLVDDCSKKNGKVVRTAKRIDDGPLQLQTRLMNKDIYVVVAARRCTRRQTRLKWCCWLC